MGYFSDTDACKSSYCVRRGCNNGVTCQGKKKKHLPYLYKKLSWLKKIKTVKYFKSIEQVHQLLIGKVNLGLQGELLVPEATISKSPHEKGHQLFIRHLLESVSEEGYFTEEDSPRLKKRKI